MLTQLITILNDCATDLLDPLYDALGLSSLILTGGITTAQQHPEILPLHKFVDPVFSQYALYISMVVGVVVIIEKLVLIYIRIRNRNK